MASFLARALYLDPIDGRQFSDVPADSVHLGAINAIAAAGITKGCDSAGTRSAQARRYPERKWPFSSPARSSGSRPSPQIGSGRTCTLRAHGTTGSLNRYGRDAVPTGGIVCSATETDDECRTPTRMRITGSTNGNNRAAGRGDSPHCRRVAPRAAA